MSVRSADQSINKSINKSIQMYETPQTIDRYLNVPLECSCGRTHYAPIKAVRVCPGALNALPGLVKELGYARPYILCDPITYKIAGERCETLLKEAGIEASVRILRHLDFDEATLGEIVAHLPKGCDLMIGVGTGSITDMTRFSSFRLNLPCFTVATGAPMDGFTASIGIMRLDGLKATMPAHSTEVIIGDTDILKNAPFRMTLAGFGDLVAKVSSLNDWKLDALVNDAHYCKNIADLVRHYTDCMIARSEELKAHDPAAIGDTMNALLLTGSAISLYGTSRAVSGSEHHMSHYWEVVGEQTGSPLAMHGEQVSVGTFLSLRLCEKLRELTPDFAEARKKAEAYDPAAWEKEIRRAYGTAADAVLELERRSGKNAKETRLRRIGAMEAKWDKIRELLCHTYPSGQFRTMMQSLGCPCEPKDIGVSPELLRDTYLYSKDTRAVYTVCQLAWDLGVTEELAGQITEELKAEGAFHI